MKKKLQLKKEIVSILDRNQMNNLTKGAAGTGINTGTVIIRTQKTDCPTGWTDVCTDNTIACATFACPSKGCISDPCIEQTEVCPNPSEGCQPETDICDFSDLYCATNDGCYCAASKDTCIG